MNKRTLIVGNWKMNLSVGQSSLLVHRLDERIKAHRDIEVVLSPSMLSLQPVSVGLNRRKFRLASQDAYHKDEGGYTGEVSFAMVQQLVHYGIVGHSARRIYFHESLEEVRDKVAAAVRNGITPILCIGETKEERQNGETRQVLHDQLTTAFQHLTAEEVRNAVVAYEPVWAISAMGGEVAKPDVVSSELAFVRRQVRDLYGEQVSNELRVLYGGSVDEQDARSYLELADCDGVLVGAASLNYVKFSAIIDSAYRLHRERKEPTDD